MPVPKRRIKRFQSKRKDLKYEPVRAKILLPDYKEICVEALAQFPDYPAYEYFVDMNHVRAKAEVTEQELLYFVLAKKLFKTQRIIKKIRYFRQEDVSLFVESVHYARELCDLDDKEGPLHFRKLVVDYYESHCEEDV